MSRLFTSAFVAATLIALMPFSGNPECQVRAQQITVTVEPDKEKQPPSSQPPFKGKRPAVDVAILLDTSSSMSGLITQAQTQLWNIVKQFSAAEKAGQTPQLRVSIFEYGNSGLPASEGYIRQVVQLTDDLDKVSEALFSLTTNGGDEYCGQVISEALKRLDWSSQPNAYKAIFIAGNEPFTQGAVDYKKSCKAAIEAGVVVNTIHCGDYKAGVAGFWQHGASLAEGKYLNINQDKAVVHIKTPQDKIIIDLNSQLNKTYLWFGSTKSRKRYLLNQVEQDNNALRLGGGAGLGGRGALKATPAYGNVGRDLVDSFNQDADILTRIKSDNFPEAMQEMTREQRLEHVKSMARSRKEIQKKIIAATKERDAYIEKVRQKDKPTGGPATLGDVIEQTVREQLVDSGFELKKK